jgi:non-ribosomal peptide synthetase-like protein
MDGMKATDAAYGCLHHVFEARADLLPEAPAIVSGDLVMSYGDLDARANRLARLVRARGVATGDLVGLLVERSPDAIVAILALLKAGAAYVPLDPSHPADRLRHILGEGRIATVVSEGPLRDVSGKLGVRVVEVDDPARPWESEPPSRIAAVEIGLGEAHLAYVLYTSGSTGKPKGVMAEHRNVVSFVRAFDEVVRLTHHDRVFQGFSLGFDGSVEEMWMAFSNGGALVVPPRSSRRAVGDELGALIAAGRATVFSTVPTSLSMISGALPTVRLLIVSGERCPPEVVERWATPRRRMLNVYGPTETTVNATAAECRPGLPVTIGKPLRGYDLAILGEDHRPVADGEVGELFISGPGVARGYLGQPELTASQFVAIPGHDAAGRRAYRTGDRVRMGDDGELLFLGRADNQVKVRGYRIELSEIEAVLSAHPSVRAAVVAVHEHDGTSDLAAYVTARDPGAGVDRPVLLDHLRTKLPGYMVPAFLEVLDAFPALPSGKVDRQRLPAPGARLARDDRPMRGPRDTLEKDVLRVFSNVLKNDAISIDDDFFRTLGGYSLLAARLVSLLRAECSIEVSLRDVYEHASVEALAAHLRSRGAGRARNRRNQPKAQRRTLAHSVFEQAPRATRFACAAAQAATLYAVYGLTIAPYLAWLFPFRAWERGSLSLPAFVSAWLLASAAVWPAMMALSVAVKWLVIGRFKPGAYPLWGTYYLRWWIVRRFQIMAFPGLAAGTPILPLYLRAMGAKVGKGCTIDTSQVGIFDLLSIGDETSIGVETQLLGYRVEDGHLRVGSIDVGRRCFIGIHSALGIDVRMGDDGRLDDLSLLPDGGFMSRGESRRGSPAAAADVCVPEPEQAAVARRRPVLFGLLHAAVLYGIALALLPVIVPGAAVVWTAERRWGTLGTFAALPFAGLATMLAFCLWVALLKRLILSRVRPGVYPVESALYLRKWAVDLLMQASRTLAKPLYTTIYLPAWLRLLGAKIGRRAEISTVSQLSPELVELGEQSFFADGSIIGGRRLHRGLVELRRQRVGKRSFVGNSAILPAGASLGDGCLLGCLSAPPEGAETVPDGSEWLGSPSFVLPHRVKVEGFAESVTHEPTRKLIAQRLVVDAMRIALPALLSGAQVAGFAALADYGADRLPLGLWLLALPAAAVAAAVAGLVGVILTKKVLIGTFRPTIKPLWSMFVWVNEAVNGAYETVAAPILTPLLGSPFCAPWLRGMGCHIGRHVYLETTLFSEFDLVHVGDFAALNAGAVIQNHLFEDRIMKASTLVIGDDCCVGAMAVVLYDTEMMSGSSIGPLSLLMKGETLAPTTQWLGIPTALLEQPPAPPVFAAPVVGREPSLVEGWP